ncbi:N-acetylmuramoyl-L-alanine amidase [Aminobacter sp. NyZ550]|jgi:N-acetylmuramoyl-L-alanine amidase|uniref:N-acetylmuramoyl-L-alanine amidase n=1 Tax=Aminobacter ciceronei TaxID=150723 RepID=A0ABR6CEB0_9HYPH|nr:MULTISPECIES: N-acetylmuramoyl-L-alanine amidase [Aminobacter]MBA8909605.1 N-acetylmuramoyl-L-alanine amidase [Aminobacter ciceronei]MBA9023377.1 N-acetylmuramoyl-L-alanine amidase [Aminobacter ciceronei]MRX36131.1 N-acetylmuramoyl-L-alanine amidase [Aminobacter sp. MDW-2]QNH31834.1 N-acetylmuramoyl-L-alanine amidase [Aminobacter sp. MDW-2]WAX97741.1 N-acetylmuramoyl-L-alanine amidase [Aminobacter sp. NyZ550]
MSGFQPDQPHAEVRLSPNFGQRRDGMKPDMIVLHYTGMETGDGAESWLCNPESEVSSHYLVHEDGRIVQMVREGDRAWHAGKSSWRGETDINSCSVGIEIVNPGHALGYRAFPRRQMRAVIELCLGIAERHNVAPERVLAHSDVALGRKVDPGEKFSWRMLAQSGIGHWVAPSPRKGRALLQPGDGGAAVEELQSMLALYGYGVEITGRLDAQTVVTVQAFQRHFRTSCVDGVVDSSTVSTLRRLLAALPGGLD